MATFRSYALSLGRADKRVRAILIALTFAACFAAGCITQEQVQAIVSESNLQALTADADAASTELQADPRSAQEPSADLLRRIDNFIAQNPGKPALTSPLRL